MATSASFQLNGIDATDKIEDLFFGHIDGQYVIDVLGKTGEIRSDQPVNLSLKHRDFTEPVVVTLKSDAHGRIKLGELPDIVTVTATGPDGVAHTWTPVHDQITRLHAVDAAVGEAIRIPYMGVSVKPQTSELSLLELRGNTFVADRFSSLSIKDGYVVIQDLPAGDYRLLFKDTGVEITIRIAPGEVRDGWVLAENRFLEIKDAGAVADRLRGGGQGQPDHPTGQLRQVHAGPRDRHALCAGVFRLWQLKRRGLAGALHCHACPRSRPSTSRAGTSATSTATSSTASTPRSSRATC